MHQINHKLLINLSFLALGLFAGVWGTLLTTDVKWREFNKNTKYSYERISPDSVILTVCSTETVYANEKFKH